MVDVVARIVADGNERTFNFKSNEVIFGGGRLKVDAKDIPLSVSALFEVYDEANRNTVNRSQDGQKAAENESVTNVVSDDEKSSEPQRKSRSRKTSVAAEEPVETEEGNWTLGGGDKDDSIPVTEPASEEKPTRVRRSRRTENN